MSQQDFRHFSDYTTAESAIEQLNLEALTLQNTLQAEQSESTKPICAAATQCMNMPYIMSPGLSWQQCWQDYKLLGGLVHKCLEISLQPSGQATCSDQLSKLLAVILLARDPAQEVPLLVIAHHVQHAWHRQAALDLLHILINIIKSSSRRREAQWQAGRLDCPALMEKGPAATWQRHTCTNACNFCEITPALAISYKFTTQHAQTKQDGWCAVRRDLQLP